VCLINTNRSKPLKTLQWNILLQEFCLPFRQNVAEIRKDGE
jgi:hypothetical protein